MIRVLERERAEVGREPVSGRGNNDDPFLYGKLQALVRDIVIYDFRLLCRRFGPFGFGGFI